MVERTGAAGAWIIGLVSLFSITIIFAAMAEPFNQIYNTFYNLTESSDMLATMSITRVAFTKFPIILTLGVVLYIIVYSMKREHDEQVY